MPTLLAGDVLELYLIGDPVAGTVTARYQLNGGGIYTIGIPKAVPASFFENCRHAGIQTTNGKSNWSMSLVRQYAEKGSRGNSNSP